MTVSPRSGVLLACELADLGAEMLAARLRRQSPPLTEDEIKLQVAAWWRDRRSAPNGDSVGVPRPIPLAWQ